MLNMEILSLFLAAISLAAAQYHPRNPGFRNAGFQNVRTPLATSATRDRPFISIPIVLLPDGQPVPKPKQSTYHYIGHATQNTPRQQNQRNVRQRGPIMSKSVANYQVAIPPQDLPSQVKKTTKPPKLTATQLSSQLKNTPSTFQRGRGHKQNIQPNQSNKGFQQNLEQNQQVQVQNEKQLRNPTYQQQSSTSSQKIVSEHKQNVENFVNFATNLGAAVISHHQNHQVILPTQTPATGLSFQNNQNVKVAESYLNQRPLLSNHKLNNGATFQHQVPSLPNSQAQYTQLIQSNAANQNNGYTSQQYAQLPSLQLHQQQLLNSQQPQQQLRNPQAHQQQLTNSQAHQQQLTNSQGHQQQLTNSQGHQQQLTNSQAHQQQLTNSQGYQQQLTNSQGHQQQLTNSQVHQPQLTNTQNPQHQLTNSQQYQYQLTNSQPQQLINSQPQQLTNSQQQQLNSQQHQQQLTNSQLQQLSNSQQQQEQSSSQHLQNSIQNPSSTANYLSTASAQTSPSSQTQGTKLSSGASTQDTQANLFQQNSASYRSQPNSNDVVLLSNYNSQLQHGNQQSYAVAAPQQNVASQGANSYTAQSEIPKTVLSSQQLPSTSSNAQNTQTTHTSYLNQNQEAQDNYNLHSQGEQITFPSNIQTDSGFPLHQIAALNAFSLQNAHSFNGQHNNPVYFHYQTAQDLPLSYSSLFNQGQSGYLSSQNSPQSESAISSEDQSYGSLPDIQNVFANNDQSSYTSPQEDSSSSDSSSAVDVQGYDSYSNDQSVYSSPTSDQTNQGGFISTPNVGKTYQSSQYNYLLQNTPESQSGQSSENQHSQSSSTISSGPLIYASSSKQISYSPSVSSVSSDSQKYNSGNYQQSPTYISFTTANANSKSEGATALNYSPRSEGVITPGSTYEKQSESTVKQSDTPSETSGSSEDSEYDEDEENEEEEASYKVVYIPLDILKNILSNSVENQSHS